MAIHTSIRGSRGTKLRRLACIALLGGAAAAGGGCILSPFLRAEELHGVKDVPAKYTGLDGKTFAVVVAADRNVQSTYPMLVGQVTKTVAERLKDNTAATQWIPPDVVMRFQFENPQWQSWTLQKLAKELGVERLVFIDIQEFRLNEPGNAYLWKGAASGTVGVVEADTEDTETFAFTEPVGVQFPTKETALSPSQASWDQVQVALAKRFVDRASWLFYEHEEKKTMEY